MRLLCLVLVLCAAACAPRQAAPPAMAPLHAASVDAVADGRRHLHRASPARRRHQHPRQQPARLPNAHRPDAHQPGTQPPGADHPSGYVPPARRDPLSY